MVIYEYEVPGGALNLNSAKVKVKVKFRIGALQHRSLKAYCALTPKEFLHSSLEALHTEQYTAPQLAKEGTM
jgi:hypothetical protein